ncbi:MAG: ferrous iron transport protein A [Methylobacillus sp.]|jgi:ferrous iron transport protein A|nr:ferrous iron transport protein A [Methylobacillus sp.]
MLTRNLDSLKPGEHATIRSISAEAALHQRLNALGFRVGKRIELVRRARFRGPLHVRLGTTDVIMRASEAHRIQISQQPA